MYIARNFEYLFGIKGFSDNSLNTHFTLYEGYVKNTNSILENFRNGNLTHDSIEGAEVKRRLGWEYNGMKLHEIYFESLSKTPNSINTESSLYKKITEIYGSFEKWLETFKKIATMRGIGWVALVADENGELFTLWFEEHNTGHFTNGKVILCIDMLEHAFMLDYGTKKADYVESFLKALDWKICEERFENIN